MNAARARDFVLARSGIAIGQLVAATAALTDAMALYVQPDEDKKGDERKELLGHALEHASAACRALEAAEEVIEDVNPRDVEPWDDEEDDDDEDEDEEEEDDEDGD